MAPQGHIIALELPSQEQFNVTVSVHDGLTRASPTLHPSDQGIVRSSGSNLLLLFEPTRIPPSIGGEEAVWRAKIEVKEQPAITHTSPTQRGVTSTGGGSRPLYQPAVLAVAIAVILWTCCAVAYYIYLSGVETAIFMGLPSLTPRGPDGGVGRRVEELRFANRRVEPNSGLETSDVARHGTQTSDLPAALRVHSVVVRPRAATNTGSTVGECAICLCGIVPLERATSLTCSHAYHSLCIEAWAARAATCPVCRAPIAITEQGWGREMQQRRQALSSTSGVVTDGNAVDATGGDWIRNPLFELHIAATEHEGNG